MTSPRVAQLFFVSLIALIVAHTFNMWLMRKRLDRCEAALLLPRERWCGCSSDGGR